MAKFLLRGVLNADEHGFLYGPRLTVNLLMHNIEMIGVQRVSCDSAVKIIIIIINYIFIVPIQTLSF